MERLARARDLAGHRHHQPGGRRRQDASRPSTWPARWPAAATSRVLLIDADLRRPSVATQLGIDRRDAAGWPTSSPATAISAARCTSVPADRAVQPVDVIPAGTSARRCTSSCGRRGSSAPPGGAAAVRLHRPRHAAAAAGVRLGAARQSVDGVLMVVAANQTPRKLLGEALNMLDPSKCSALSSTATSVRSSATTTRTTAEYFPESRARRRNSDSARTIHGAQAQPPSIWRRCSSSGGRSFPVTSHDLSRGSCCRRFVALVPARSAEAPRSILGSDRWREADRGDRGARSALHRGRHRRRRAAGCAIAARRPLARPVRPARRRSSSACSPSRIVVAVADRRDRLPLQSLLESRVSGIVVEDAIEFYERLTGKIAIEALTAERPDHVEGLPQPRRGRNRPRVRQHGRRGRSASCCVAPLLRAIALLVKLDSRGPVLFVQQRAGRDGRPFGLLKFRTMHPRDERAVGMGAATTCIGSRASAGWLRRFRLDELPQLVNVLRGEMNLIGPRPHPTSNHAIVRGATSRTTACVHACGPASPAGRRCATATPTTSRKKPRRCGTTCTTSRTGRSGSTSRILFETVGIIIFGQGASEVRRPAPMPRPLAGPPRSVAQGSRLRARSWLTRTPPAAPQAASERHSLRTRDRLVAALGLPAAQDERRGGRRGREDRGASAATSWRSARWSRSPPSCCCRRRRGFRRSVIRIAFLAAGLAIGGASAGAHRSAASRSPPFIPRSGSR